MSIFVPNKVYLRGILLHYFIQKKSEAEAHRILVQTYGDNALSDTTCRDSFRRFKNNDFELEDKERSGAPKKFQDKELEQLLDEDPSQTLSELGKILQVDESTVSKRLKGLGMIQKQGHWVPYELLLLLCRNVVANEERGKGNLRNGCEGGNRLEVRFAEQIDLSRRKFTAWPVNVVIIKKKGGQVNGPFTSRSLGPRRIKFPSFHQLKGVQPGVISRDRDILTLAASRENVPDLYFAVGTPSAS
ncbi:MOS1T transposase, partial [Pseudoatta argentina]